MRSKSKLPDHIDMMLIGMCLLAIAGLIVRPESVPPLWFDEGWVLSTARNWEELGHFGPLLDGRPISTGLVHIGVPVIAPVALSFRLFGVGTWQGRLPGIVFSCGAFILIYILAKSLYDRSVAVISLAVLLFLTGHAELHPILIGRQALGEVPALFYLLFGFAVLSLAWHRRLLFLPLVGISWGLSLLMKPQVLPFLAVSLVVPLIIMIIRRKWKSATFLASGVCVTLVTVLVLTRLQVLLIRHTTSLAVAAPAYGPQESISDLSDFIFVPVLRVRIAVLQVILVFGLLTAFGLYHTARCHLRWNERDWLESGQDIVHLMLLIFSGSWFAWYALFSVGWTRYLFPATFVGSIFVAVLLYDVFRFVPVSSPIQRTLRFSTSRQLRLPVPKVLLMGALVVMAFIFTVHMLFNAYIIGADSSAAEAAHFLNTQVPRDAIVETYDAELFFLLNCRYHFPPEIVQSQLNRRTFLGQSVSIDYDPLRAEPDYLVVGPHSRLWRLYDQVLQSDQYRLLQVYRRYAIYLRVG